MNERIKKLVRTLQLEYYAFIALSLLLCISYEAGWLAEGMYATDVRMQYILETIGILLAVSLVPLSLKLFSMVLAKRIKKVSLPVAMTMYRNWNEIRLLLLALVVFVNIFVYYATLNNIGGLCALIGVTASVFCLPGEKKMKEELDITNKLEE